MEFLRVHQLNIMLFMSGACGILALMTFFTKNIPKNKKSILALLEISVMILFLCDRGAYIYRGNISIKGYYFVRICNGIVFFLNVFGPYLVTQYLKILYGPKESTKSYFLLRICDVLFGVATILIIISQFTGLYYTFTDNNVYVRSSGFVISYIFPFLIIFIQIITIIQNKQKLGKNIVVLLLCCVSLPLLTAIIQVFIYGLSLINMAFACVVIIFHICTLIELNKEMDQIRQHEIEAYVLAEQREALLFEETVESLSYAIDAKDKYTSGHSIRVALLSKKIAVMAGYDDNDCRLIYFAGLLHDIGKIGIRDEVLNKQGKLTEEEFEEIKEHTVIGYQILSRIKQSPKLSDGAHYHHERYDGTGYPEMLKGEEIPWMARIISVSDAYDAMSSTRSYRDKLSKDKIREELISGMGSQFDPKFAEIMLKLL